MATTKQKLVVVGAGVAVAGISSALTYFATRKLREAEYEVRLADELQKSIEFLTEQIRTGQIKIENVSVVSEEEMDRIETEPEEPVEPEPLPEVDGLRVFTEDEKPPLDELAKNQAVRYDKIMTPAEYETAVLPEEPIYEDPDISVISKDIFEENGTGWEQSILTYFADKGVIDEMGDFVDEPTLLIGEQAPPFGEMSEDPQIVYLRNKKIQTEYQVIQDPGNAADFINTHEDEGESLQHSLQALQAQYAHHERRR